MLNLASPSLWSALRLQLQIVRELACWVVYNRWSEGPVDGRDLRVHELEKRSRKFSLDNEIQIMERHKPTATRTELAPL